jgi:hypothetical protein
LLSNLEKTLRKTPDFLVVTIIKLIHVDMNNSRADFEKNGSNYWSDGPDILRYQLKIVKKKRTSFRHSRFYNNENWINTNSRIQIFQVNFDYIPPQFLAILPSGLKFYFASFNIPAFTGQYIVFYYFALNFPEIVPNYTGLVIKFL